jgi:hypothetical protein
LTDSKFAEKCAKDLFDIYSENEKQWTERDFDEALRNTIIEIGKKLNERGGIRLIRLAFHQFNTRCIDYDFIGASENLNGIWSGIGNWPDRISKVSQ